MHSGAIKLPCSLCERVVPLSLSNHSRSKKNPSNHNSLHHVMQRVGLLKVRRYHPLAQQPIWKTTFVSYLSNHFTLQTCTYVIKRNIIVQIYLKKLGGNNNAPLLDYPLLYQLRVLHKLSNYVRGGKFST